MKTKDELPDCPVATTVRLIWEQVEAFDFKESVDAFVAFQRVA